MGEKTKKRFFILIILKIIFMSVKNLRNIAIIAHVDHGKTTLVDAILKQTAAFGNRKEQGDLIMDSMDLERERGITIKSKNASVNYKGIKINIIDTPGHADFGSEVERVLRMADGVILLVDAKEGPMPQTKFVLKKSLKLGHKVIVMINKIDRQDARSEEVVDKVFELFMELEASDEQLDFPVLFASGVKGIASADFKTAEAQVAAGQGDLTALFDLILEKIPEPSGDENLPLQILILNLTYDNYKGRIVVGRVDNGKINSGQNAILIKKDGTKIKSRVTGLLAFSGIERIEVPEIKAGDIVAVAGFADAEIGETIADPDNPIALEVLSVDEPTIEMIFRVNDSPLSGREGKFCTSRNLRERLFKELETNVGLKVKDTEISDSFLVSGRGELHLAILIEQMRREGYEMAVSKPEVIYKEIDGKKMEPFETLVIECPQEYSGTIIDTVGKRKGLMDNLTILPNGGQRFEFTIPTRGILGLKNALVLLTKGTAEIHHLFLKYAPVIQGLEGQTHASMVSMDQGKAVAYALWKLQERGTIFINPNDEVYNGMVIGESNRDSDEMRVNPLKEKKQSNVRSKATDEAITLIPPKVLTIESALEYMNDDELLEVTPKSLRLRKKSLSGK